MVVKRAVKGESGDQMEKIVYIQNVPPYTHPHIQTNQETPLASGKLMLSSK